MAKIIGVRLQPRGELLYCDAGDLSLKAGDYVILGTSHGSELAKVVLPQTKIQASDLTGPPIHVAHQAQPEELEKTRQRQGREEEALIKCKEIADRLGLKMKPLSAHYNLDGSHLAMLFSARERVDFRGLIRKLSRSLKTRVELRQIGPRDEAKLVGSIGKCGYPLCCQSFLTNFAPVSIQMAKEQNLALNPMKISGVCGRLLCCLAYESKEYVTIKRKMPQLNQEVSTPFGKANVLSTNLLKETVTVKFDTQTIRELPLDQLTWEPG